MLFGMFIILGGFVLICNSGHFFFIGVKLRFRCTYEMIHDGTNKMR